MSPYWLIPIFLIIATVGFCGYRYGKDSAQLTCDKHEESQQQVTISAENKVITNIGNQQTITQRIENAYTTSISVIDGLYSATGVQPAMPTASNGADPLPHRTSGFNGTTCQPSRYYKLSAKECDDNTTQLISLQNWVKQQGTVK